jgi:hypothetical protein
MALMSDVDLPVAHVRAQVASAIDLLVHTARLRDGRRVSVPDRGRRRPRRRGRARRDRGPRSARPLAGTGPCTRTHRAGRSSAGFFPAKRPAIWRSQASPALMRRPHAHPGEDRYRRIHAISLRQSSYRPTRLKKTARKMDNPRGKPAQPDVHTLPRHPEPASHLSHRGAVQHLPHRPIPLLAHPQHHQHHRLLPQSEGHERTHPTTPQQPQCMTKRQAPTGTTVAQEP